MSAALYWLCDNLPWILAVLLIGGLIVRQLTKRIGYQKPPRKER